MSKPHEGMHVMSTREITTSLSKLNYTGINKILLLCMHNLSTLHYDIIPHLYIIPIHL